MRWRNGALLAAALALVSLDGCNRLTFIKPNMKKIRTEQVRELPDVRDSAADRQRMAQADALQLAGNRLQAGDLDAAEVAEALRDEVFEASGAGHEHVEAAGERVGLRFLADTAEDGA